MAAEEVDSNEYIIRRIPAPLDQSTKVVDGVERPTSQRMQLRTGVDTGLSCSRISTTSPKALLEQLSTHGIDPDGWGVCVLLVEDIKKLGFEVVSVPEELDKGHCEIRGDFVRKTPKRLAKIARMLSDDEIISGQIVD